MNYDETIDKLTTLVERLRNLEKCGDKRWSDDIETLEEVITFIHMKDDESYGYDDF